MSEEQFCDDCNFLTPKEQEQERGVRHMCLILDKCVCHLSEHPRLPRLAECPFSPKDKQLTDLTAENERLRKIIAGCAVCTSVNERGKP